MAILRLLSSSLQIQSYLNGNYLNRKQGKEGNLLMGRECATGRVISWYFTFLNVFAPLDEVSRIIFLCWIDNYFGNSLSTSSTLYKTHRSFSCRCLPPPQDNLDFNIRWLLGEWLSSLDPEMVTETVFAEPHFSSRAQSQDWLRSAPFFWERSVS